MSQITFRSWLRMGAIALLAGLMTALASAQTPAASSDAAKPDGPESSQANGPVAAPDEPAPLMYAPTLDQPGIKELGGSGNWFSDNVKLFSIGPVAVRFAEILFGYSSANPQAGFPASLSTGIFQTNVAYSKRLRRSLLVWQYNPRLFYDNGQVSLAAANQDGALNTLFAPTPHLTVGVSESLSFYGPLNTFNDKTLAGSTDVAVVDPFLNSLGNGQKTWLDSFSVPITYSPGARTTVQLTPFFNYVRTSEANDASSGADATGNPPALSMFNDGARLQLSRSLSPDSTIGMFYLFQLDRQTGVPGTTNFDSFGISGSRHLGRSLTVTADAGGSRYNGYQSNGWTVVGSVSVAKTFQHSSVEGAFGRDSAFTGLVGGDYNNRAWATYSRQASRSLKFSLGGGYLNGAVLGQTTTGKYANVGVNYSLGPTLGWYASYVHFWETGIGTQLMTGGQSQFQMGLRWTPRFRPGS